MIAVIEQTMYFAACQECDWQSVLVSDERAAEGMGRTHDAQAHGSEDQES